MSDEAKDYCSRCGLDITNQTHEFYGDKMYCHSDCKIDELEAENAELDAERHKWILLHSEEVLKNADLKKRVDENCDTAEKLRIAYESEKEFCMKVIEKRDQLTYLCKTLAEALEEAVRDCEVFDVSGILEKNFPSTIRAIRENQKRYNLALEQYRKTVKE